MAPPDRVASWTRSPAVVVHRKRIDISGRRIRQTVVVAINIIMVVSSTSIISITIIVTISMTRIISRRVGRREVTSAVTRRRRYKYNTQHNYINCFLNLILIQAPYSARLVADLRQLMTLRQHYYPEGGWGWVLVVVCFLVQSISHGLHLALGILVMSVITEFQQSVVAALALCSLSFAVGLGFSPITISLCKRKSTRLVSVIGGLVTALGCLFTSFALQYQQILLSFG